MASALKRLLVQTSHYSFSSLLTMVAGLITFPVLTHVLPVADYGVLSLISATLTIGVALGKTGLQHSITRFQSEVAEGKSAYTRAQLYSTTVFGMTGASLVVTVLLLIGIQVLPAGWFGGAEYAWAFRLAAGLIIIQVMDSALTNFLRAEQQTLALMKYSVIKKYFGLGLIMLAVLVVWRGSLNGFYLASLLSEGLTVVALAWCLKRSERGPPALSQFSSPLYRQLVHFGIPMLIGYELSGIVLMVGDRYIIQGKLGEEQVGLYSAAYNLCMYVQAVVIASVSQAIMPLYMQMWAQKGVDETSAFIAKSLRTYVLIGAPVVAGIAAVGPALLTSLASRNTQPRPAAGVDHRRHGGRRHELDGGRGAVHSPQDAGDHDHRDLLRPAERRAQPGAHQEAGHHGVGYRDAGELLRGRAVAGIRGPPPAAGAAAVGHILALGSRGDAHVLCAGACVARQGTVDRRRSYRTRRRRVWSWHADHRSGRALARPQGAGALAAREQCGWRGRGMSAAAIAKRLVKQTVASAWGWRVTGAVLRKPGVIVLMYHRILGRDRTLSGLPVEAFAEQMRWVRQHCDPIGLDAFTERAQRPSRLRPAVLVTFDDGYRDYHDLAYPVLKGLAIPAVVFLATSFMDEGGMLWTDDVQWAALSTKQDSVKLPWSDEAPIALPDRAAREALGERARTYLKDAAQRRPARGGAGAARGAGRSAGARATDADVGRGPAHDGPHQLRRPLAHPPDHVEVGRSRGRNRDRAPAAIASPPRRSGHRRRSPTPTAGPPTTRRRRRRSCVATASPSRSRPARESPAPTPTGWRSSACPATRPIYPTSSGWRRA